MVNLDPRSYLGRGWAFPLNVNHRGGISLLTGEEDIESAIKMILLTSKGERVMRPTFGSSLNDFVFATNNTSTHGLIAFEIRDALEMWEPRIDITDVVVDQDPEADNCILIDVRYTVKATNDERNLVFPFYIIPGEE